MIKWFLIKFEPWVFVHASFKHVSHTLISKFLCLIGHFEIRVLSDGKYMLVLHTKHT